MNAALLALAAFCLALAAFGLWANFRLHECRWCQGTGRTLFRPDHPCSICDGRGKIRT